MFYGPSETSHKRCDVWLLEHPSFLGIRSHEDIGALCREAERLGATVIIDESNANYLQADQSWLHRLDAFGNLIVLRGFSKLYSLGSLRLGVSLCSAPLRDRVRECMVPLATSTLSLQLAAQVWKLGDIGSRVRTIIARRKLAMKQALELADVSPMQTESPFLPYVLLPSCDTVRLELDTLNIKGKRYAVGTAENAESFAYRLSIPLLDSRWHQLLRHIHKDT